MSWFADLTPYSYFANADGRRRLNVGWLENGRPFDTGPTLLGLAERLAALADHARVVQTRGLHACDLCEESPPWDDYSRLSSAEIRVVDEDGTIYAAPTLIHHYVAAHRYRPPPAFTAAVLAHADMNWESALRDDACFSCGRAMVRTQEHDAHVVDGGEMRPVRVFTLRCERCGEDYKRSVPK